MQALPASGDHARPELQRRALLPAADLARDHVARHADPRDGEARDARARRDLRGPLPRPARGPVRDRAHPLLLPGRPASLGRRLCTLVRDASRAGAPGALPLRFGLTRYCGILLGFEAMPAGISRNARRSPSAFSAVPTIQPRSLIAVGARRRQPFATTAGISPRSVIASPSSR